MTLTASQIVPDTNVKTEDRKTIGAFDCFIIIPKVKDAYARIPYNVHTMHFS